jgi:4'-phosphopantetheinyl transferase
MLEIAYLDMTSPSAERLVAEFATEQDYETARRHHRPQGQSQHLLVRVLLRAVLAKSHDLPATAWRILRAPDGAPRLAAEGVAKPPFVSLSHSGALVACAVDDHGPIGVDVERIRTDRPLMALARTAFGPRETASIEQGGAEAFYRIWTLREALAKASGEGFGLLTNRIDLVLPGPGGDFQRPSLHGIEWDLAYWRLPSPYGLGVARHVGSAQRIAAAGKNDRYRFSIDPPHRLTAYIE